MTCSTPSSARAYAAVISAVHSLGNNNNNHNNNNN